MHFFTSVAHPNKMIGIFLKNIIKKEAISRVLPIAKKVLVDVGKTYVEGAAKTAGEKAVGTITKTPQKVEEFVNKKKSEFLDEAESKAEQFFASQMEILDLRINKKIIEIESKLDEKIRNVYRLFLVSTIVLMIIAGAAFLMLFKYFNF
jgi:hypothetical protein